MEDFFKSIGLSVAAIMMLAFVAFISGTILYWIWPIAIPAAFPGLVATGVIAAKLEWWAAVCLTWLFGILIKSTTVNNK